MCMCGHTSGVFSIGAIPAFVFACYLFFGFHRRSRLEQILGAVAFALLVGMLLKNLADILYFGHSHDPLLR